MDSLPNFERDAHRLDGQLLSDLWVFRAAARFSSITEAARSLSVTQGAVSQRVQRLEGRLEVQLFARCKGRITLTASGLALLEAMTEVASILNDSLSRIQRHQRGALVIRCLPSLATEWLVPNLPAFYEEHPGIEIFVRAEMVPPTAERLQDDAIDVVIDYSPGAPGGLHELASIDEHIFPVCSRGYAAFLANRLPDETVTLLHDDVPWFGGTPGDEWRQWEAKAEQEAPAQPVQHRHFNLAHLAYHAAICDQGIAMGRAAVVQRLMTRGELVGALGMPAVTGARYRILTDRPGDANAPVRLFAAWWKDAMTEAQEQTLSLLGADDAAFGG